MRKEIIEFLNKDHYIRIGLEHKLAMIFLFLIIIFILFPYNIAMRYTEDKTTRINMVCRYPMIASCNDLDEALPHCIEANRWYDLKNCSVVMNG